MSHVWWHQILSFLSDFLIESEFSCCWPDCKILTFKSKDVREIYISLVILLGNSIFIYSGVYFFYEIISQCINLSFVTKDSILSVFQSELLDGLLKVTLIFSYYFSLVKIILIEILRVILIKKHHLEVLIVKKKFSRLNIVPIVAFDDL